MVESLNSASWVLAICIGLLLSFLGRTWWIRRRTGESLLQDVIWRVELIDKRMFHSVREIEGKLESILNWTERTEQKLHHLLVQPIAARADQYATAALLISEGKKAEDVARTLKLPPAQVHVIEELRHAVESTEEPEVEAKGNSVKPEPEAQGKIGLHTRAMAMAEREESPISGGSSSQSQVPRRAANRKQKSDSPRTTTDPVRNHGDEPHEREVTGVFKGLTDEIISRGEGTKLPATASPQSHGSAASLPSNGHKRVVRGSPTGRKKESLYGGLARQQNGAPHQEKVPIPPDIIKLRESTARLEERLQQDVKTIKQQVYATQAE